MVDSWRRSAGAQLRRVHPRPSQPGPTVLVESTLNLTAAAPRPRAPPGAPTDPSALPGGPSPTCSRSTTSMQPRTQCTCVREPSQRGTAAGAGAAPPAPWPPTPPLAIPLPLASPPPPIPPCCLGPGDDDAAPSRTPGGEAAAVVSSAADACSAARDRSSTIGVDLCSATIIESEVDSSRPDNDVRTAGGDTASQEEPETAPVVESSRAVGETRGVPTGADAGPPSTAAEAATGGGSRSGLLAVTQVVKGDTARVASLLAVPAASAAPTATVPPSPPAASPAPAAATAAVTSVSATAAVAAAVVVAAAAPAGPLGIKAEPAGARSPPPPLPLAHCGPSNSPVVAAAAATPLVAAPVSVWWP